MSLSQSRNEDVEDGGPLWPPAGQEKKMQDAAVSPPTLAPHNVQSSRFPRYEDSESTTAGGSAATGTSAQPQTVKRRKRRTYVEAQRPKQTFARRRARVFWALLMWTPMIAVLLMYSDDLYEHTDGKMTTMRVIGAAAILGALMTANELLDGLQWPYYLTALLMGFLWGSVLEVLQSHVAVRMGSVILFGIAAGSLRYHWDIKRIKRLRRATRNSQQQGERGTPSDGNSTNQQGSRSKVAASPRSPQRSTDRVLTDGDALGPRIMEFLARTIGVGPFLMLGEILGCAFLVNDGWVKVSMSWGGYLGVAFFPLVTYKFASSLSHVLVIMFGSRVNTADASRLLAIQWISTTVISVALLIFGVGYFVIGFVNYLWSLQLLVCPYCVVVEVVAWESRKQQKENPYREVAENYKEHVEYIKARKDQYLK